MTNKPSPTLGSLFDGIGGFPYAGKFFGIRPLWASEVLSSAVSVTKRHLPEMAHVGDITKLDGGKLPPVDIITFGSPCQGNAEEIDIPRKRERDCRNIDTPHFLEYVSQILRDNTLDDLHLCIMKSPPIGGKYYAEVKLMEHVSVQILVDRTLYALQGSGASEKRLKDYKCSGFGPLLRYFEDNGISSYSKDAADDFIFQIRSEYEHGEISRWKWNIVRRCAELLEQFHTTGNIVMAPLPKWEVLHNPLHRAPTPQELADANNLFSLAYRTKQALIEMGYESKTIANYVYDGFDAILRYCSENGRADYSKGVIDAFVVEARTKYENHAMCRSVYQNIRKIAALLDEYHETGRLEWKRVSAWNMRKPTVCYSNALELFCRENTKTGALANSTMATVRSAVRRFLFELEDCGFTDFCEVSLRVVSGCVSHISTRYAGGLKSMLFAVRMFLRFLHDHGATPDDLSLAIPEFVAPRRIVREGFAQTR